MKKKRIHFGVLIQGHGANMNAWKHPSVPPDASINFDFYVDRARKAESAGIAFAFIADGLYIHERSMPHFLNRFEPMALLSALAPMTSRIGLVGTISTSYSDPFTVARQFASLDIISRGRAGWNVVTSSLEGSGKNYTRPFPDHEMRYEIGQEHVEVVKGLWDSWDEGAFVRNRETGQFFELEKMHRLNHKGRFFSVEGPLNSERPTQGWPVIFHAGSSADGIRLGGMHGDCIFSNGGTIDEAKAFYKRLKESAAAQGRNPDDVKIFPGVGPIVGRTEKEAEAKHREVAQLLSPKEALNFLGHFFQGHDFSKYAPDAPFPELGDLGANGFQALTQSIQQRARDKKMTLLEVAYECATRRTNIGTSENFIGTADKVADEMIRWVEEGAADGFMLGLPCNGFGLDDVVEQLLPVLAERGYHDMALRGNTLRENLGLPFPQSRYARVAETETA
jgi:FMN-dependent oxidoreductase (nitrilotriacetate monooxygenase family)